MAVVQLRSEQRHLPVAPPAVLSAAQPAVPAVPDAAQPALVWSPHPLIPEQGRELLYEAQRAGETLAGYLTRLGITQRIGHAHAVLKVNGARVPRRMWPHVRPKHGMLIEVNIMARGGGGGRGGGKNPIATVISLAVLVFNPAVGIFGLASRSFGALLVNAAIGMVANALFAPPQANLSNASGRDAGGASAATESPTYSISGGSNRARPYEPMPVIMGRHILFLDYGARTYTESEGEDQTLFQVFDAGYNDVLLSSFKIGSNPIANYEALTIEESNASGVLTLFPTNIDSQDGADLVPSAPVVRTSSIQATRLAVEMAGQLFSFGSSGAIGAAGVTIKIQFRLVGAGGWTDLLYSSATASGTAVLNGGDTDAGGGQVSITSSARAPLRRTYTWLVASGQYEVRVERITADNTSNSVTDDVSWSQLRTYQPDDADYTGRKRLAVKARASRQLQGQIEQLSVIASARCLTWTGAAWVLAETSNPAWWFLQAARGKFAAVNGVTRLVWGGGLADARIDIETLKVWGAWCAANNLTFDGVFDQPKTAQDMLSAIAYMGRATLTWHTGKLGVVWDAADQPVVGIVGMGSIIAGSFEIEYVSDQLADELVVRFVNPDIDWQQDQLRVLAPGVTVPTLTKSVELFGCKDKTQAGQHANLLIAQNVYRYRKYKWRMDFEGFPYARGNVLRFAHDLGSADYSGRLIEGSTASVLKLSRKVVLGVSGGTVTLVKPDGSFANHAVVAGSGAETDTLTLVAALGYNPGADAAHPPYDYRFLFGAQSVGTGAGRKVKIDSISYANSSQVIQISAIDEVAAYYQQATNPIIYLPPSPLFGVPGLANLAATADGVRAGTGYLARVAVTWEASGDFDYADLDVGRDGGPLLQEGTTRSRRYEFNVQDRTPLVIRVTAYSSTRTLGKFEQATIEFTPNYAAASPPAALAGFRFNATSLEWDESPEADVIGYRIRFHYGDRRTWDDAAPMHDGLITDNPWPLPARPVGQVTFLLKAEDAAGLQSVAAAIIVTDLGDAITAQIIEAADYKALGFPGTVTAGSVSGGNLVADTDSDVGWSPDDAVPAWTYDSAAGWTPSTYKYMVYDFSFTPSAAWRGGTLTVDADIVGAPFTLEYRGTSAVAGWSADTDPGWGASDAALAWYTAAFVTWPGASPLLLEPYDFRITTAQGGTQGVISTLTLNVDVPFITESVNDVTISAGGTRLTLTETYYAIKNVQLTFQTAAGGAVRVETVDKHATLGPLIQGYNAANAGAACLVDAVIQGY